MLTQEFTPIETIGGLVAQVGKVLEAQPYVVVMVVAVYVEGETKDVVWFHRWDGTRSGEQPNGSLPTKEETSTLGWDSCVGPRQKAEVGLKQCKAGTDRGGCSCIPFPLFEA